MRKTFIEAARRLLDRTRPVAQAGGIVLRSDGSQAEVLIVTARRSTKRWVLPKGTIKKGERAKDAALREVREEAGVTGRVLGSVGKTRYWNGSGRVEIEYFLIAYRKPTKGHAENRSARWCAVTEAARRLSNAKVRRLLLEARPVIQEHVSRGSLR